MFCSVKGGERKIALGNLWTSNTRLGVLLAPRLRTNGVPCPHHDRSALQLEILIGIIVPRYQDPGRSWEAVGVGFGAVTVYIVPT